MNTTSPEKSREYGKIFKVKFTGTSLTGVLREVRAHLLNLDKTKARQPLVIFTPNPEQVLLAQKDQNFLEILNKSDISVVDAIGIVMAFRFFELETPTLPIAKTVVIFAQGILVGLSAIFNKKWLYREIEVVRGRELFMRLIQLANKMKLSVFLLGSKPEVVEMTAEVLKRSYKGLKIDFAPGPWLDDNANPKSGDDILIEKKVITKIASAKPDLLFVAYGAPKQEKWVHKWRGRLNSRVIMVVGGTYDYVAGVSKLPPKFMSQSGLEWLWRFLVFGPKRMGRIFQAFPIFPLKVFRYKLQISR